MTGGKSSRRFVVGDWTIHPEQNLVQRDGDVVHLEPRVMDLLVYLAEHPNEVLNPEQIINDVWPHTFVTGGALMTAISALRKALGDSARAPSYIATIPKRGYRLIAGSTAPKAVLAVLPISNASADRSRSFLAEGLTTGLIDSLGTVSALRVISRSSVMRLSAAHASIEEVAAKLGANLVLSGSMDFARSKLTVHFALTDVTSGKALLDGSFSRPEDELLELERDIVEAIATVTADRLRSRPSPKATDARPGAVIEHLRGRYHYYRQSPAHLDRALEHFQRAAAIDSAYAPAHVGIADVWGAFGYWGVRDARSVRDRVLRHVGKALEIAPDAPEALVIRAAHRMYLQHDFPAAEADLRRAIALNPNLCHTRLIHALFLATLRRPQAPDESDRALRIDPLNPAVLLVRALIDSALGAHAAALAETEELLAIDPSHPPGLQLRAELHWTVGDADAIGLERAVWHSDAEILSALASGKMPGALGAAADLLIERSRGVYVAPYEIARLLGLAGQCERALDVIEAALDAGDFMRIDFLQLSPAFAAVREHARYRPLASRLGIPA